MADSFADKWKRLAWLYKSADLTFSEALKIAINKLIGGATAAYYCTKGLIFRGDYAVIVGYKKYLPKDIKQPKRALLNYMIGPFYKEYYVGDLKYYFSNNGVILSLAKALNQMGYVVDTIKLDKCDYKTDTKYDLIFAPGFYNYENVQRYITKDTVNVFFAVVAYWRVVDKGVKERLAAFKNRHGVELPEKDLNYFTKTDVEAEREDKFINSVDGIVVIGDKMSKSFVPPMPVAYNTTTGVCLDKNYKKDLSPATLETAKKHFLFFGGGRDNIRKGLDLVIESFIGTDNHLYLCCEVHPLIRKTLKLDEQKNIHQIGYLKQRSKRFYEVIEKCGYIIQPSVSESIPGGVLDCVQYGLIPVVSTGCNMPEEDGAYVISEINLDNVKKAVAFVSSQSGEWLAQRAKRSVEVCFSKFTLEAFEKDIQIGISKVIEAKQKKLSVETK